MSKYIIFGLICLLKLSRLVTKMSIKILILSSRKILNFLECHSYFSFILLALATRWRRWSDFISCKLIAQFKGRNLYLIFVLDTILNVTFPCFLSRNASSSDSNNH